MSKATDYFEETAEVQKRFNKVRDILNCTNLGSECLRNADSHRVTYLQGALVPTFGLYKGSRILTDDPTTLLKSITFDQPLDVMIGTTAAEAARAFCIYATSSTDESSSSAIDDSGRLEGNITDMLTRTVVPRLWKKEPTPELVKKIEEEYFPDDVRRDPKKVTAQFIQALSHLSPVVPVIRLAKLFAAKGIKPYFYTFDHPLSMHVDIVHKEAEPYMAPIKKTCKFLSEYSYQYVDLPMLFGRPISGDFSRYVWHRNDYTSADKEMSQLMMKLWTNFAKTGKPSGVGSGVQWLPFETNNHDYLLIKHKNTQMKILNQSVSFWEKNFPDLFLPL